MVIRLTKANRFFCVCSLLLVAALISIGTRSITVSTPYTTEQRLPVVRYSKSLSTEELEKDLNFLAECGLYSLSESELVLVLRNKKSVPEHSVLLLFDDRDPLFSTKLFPLLKEKGISWLSKEQFDFFGKKLQLAGYRMQRCERVPGEGLSEIL